MSCTRCGCARIATTVSLWCALLGASPTSATVLVDLRPTPSLSMYEGAVEVRVDQRLHVGLGRDIQLHGTSFGAVIGTDYYTLRMRSIIDDKPPARGFWTMGFECENTRTYAGKQTVTSRVLLWSGGGTWIDFVEFECVLRHHVAWSAPSRTGEVPTYQSRTEAVSYIGRRIGPAHVRLGITETNPPEWRAGFALPL